MTKSVIVNGFKTEGKCRENSFYVRFNDEDIEELTKYAFDMGYVLEPEVNSTDTEYPLRFKIISKANPRVYGWVSKVTEKIDDQWQDTLLYGFYRHGSFRVKYPISFNIHSRLMRGMIKRKTEMNPRQMIYFRTLFGIMDLEPEHSPLDFIFSWLSACKIQRV